MRGVLAPSGQAVAAARHDGRGARGRTCDAGPDDGARQRGPPHGQEWEVVTLWRGAGVAFCVKCNAERPTIKAGRKRLCVTCKEPVFVNSLSKYRNIPTRSRHTGLMFQSKKEANREPVLLAMQNAGEITDLKYQQPFRLEVYGTEAVNALMAYLLQMQEAFGFSWSPGLTKLLDDVCRSRQCIAIYKADFTYKTKAGELVVEDPKGYVKPEYRMKKKLMLAAHGIEIQEPGEGGVQMRARGAGIHGRGTGARLMGGR